MKILFPRFLIFIVNETLFKRLLGTFHFLSTKDNRNPNPQIFAGAVWKTKSGGFIFCRHFWKVCRVQFWSASRKKKIRTPLFENPHSLLGGGGRGRGVVEDKKWNVPWKRKRCLTNLELLLAEAVLEDVLGLGREKPVAEPPLRNELVEVADPCTPTVPDVDVSSSKPSIKLYKIVQ